MQLALTGRLVPDTEYLAHEYSWEVPCCVPGISVYDYDTRGLIFFRKYQVIPGTWYTAAKFKCKPRTDHDLLTDHLQQVYIPYLPL